MRTLLAVPLFFALLLPVAAQPVEIPEPPVRYDEDLLSPTFHEGRRAAVMEALPENAVAIFFSAPMRNRENDVDFEYRQDSDLLYLTGTHEPESVLLLAPGGITVDGETVNELLLVPPRNAFTEVWVGRRFGAERAQATLGVEKAISNERFGEILAMLAQDETRQFFHLPLPTGVAEGSDLADQLATFQEQVKTFSISGNFLAQNATRLMLSATTPDTFARAKAIISGRLEASDIDDPSVRAAFEAFMAAEDADAWNRWREENFTAIYADSVLLPEIMQRLRAIKTDEELALLQQAIDITTAAHREAMRSLEPGMYEYEIEALVEYIFRRNGAEYTGFPSIVGSGENATILHYNTNRRPMTADDVVVIDIGAEYHGYTADVTRTLPVSGTFSPEQKAIYELVLAAQEAGIRAARAGNPYQAPGQAASQTIDAGLRELGILQSGGNVRSFFMHGTSHYLGMYVHDVGDYGPLKPGEVITVEPGIYINPSPDVDPKWWNIGVRIEDDVLITNGDPVNLSSAAPRTVEDIEALMQEQGLGNLPNGVTGTH